jgi:hypothetical protein
MTRRRKTGTINQGVTRVLGCCEFPWTEAEGRRVATLPSDAHEACIEELQRSARVHGVLLDLEVDTLTEPSSVYPLVVTVTVKQ